MLENENRSTKTHKKIRKLKNKKKKQQRKEKIKKSKQNCKKTFNIMSIKLKSSQW